MPPLSPAATWRPVIYCLLLLVGGLLLSVPTARAQGENSNWCFGAGVLVSFQNGAVTGTGQSSILTDEAASTVSTPQGALLFYTNGATIWDRTHAPMPNGTGLHGHPSSLQGALIVRQPGSSTRYYVFTTDAYENNLREGLQYSEVDLALRGGLGDVTAVKNVRLPAPLLSSAVEEGVIAVPHANRRDVWVVVRERQYRNAGGVLSAFLVTPAGVAAAPVTSALAPSAITQGRFRFSPDGEHLVMMGLGNLWLYDFSVATGQITNPRIIASPLTSFSTGVEFSADGSKLYALRTYGTALSLYQYDLLAGSTAAIQGSELLIPPVSGISLGGFHGSLERGPDNRIYCTGPYFTMGVVAEPNRLGTACRYQAQALPLRLNGVYSDGSIQNFVQPLLGPQFAPHQACAGHATAFAAHIPSPDPGATVQWDFGDPASGAANAATGPSAAHAFATAGAYRVTVQVTWGGGGQTAVTDTVVVGADPTARLGARTRQLCVGTAVRLRLNAQPAGTRYHWSDNSTDSTLLVQAAGRYWVEVTTAQGCSARDTVRVDVGPLPALVLTADTVLCLDRPVRLRPNAQPAGTTYRWADGSTAPAYTAAAPGVYRLRITNAQGCSATDSLAVRWGNCPVLIPNIITPNDDGQNEAFVLRGLEAAAWRLEVYNRWGARVYQALAYDNQWRAAGQPGGTYYYLLTNGATGQRYRGWVEVVKN